VGVTGGIGSGKSALTDRLATRGITVVDADVAAREVVRRGTEALDAIRRRYGDDILTPDGDLDRAALRRIVFEDVGERRWLEALTHPLIGEHISASLEAADSPYVVLASPLLLEGEQHRLVEHVVVVDVPEALQVERACARDGNAAELVERIMAAQLDRATRLARADTVIDNSGSLAELDAKAGALHATLLEKALRRQKTSAT
jgi:dephospho-CoA kinase